MTTPYTRARSRSAPRRAVTASAPGTRGTPDRHDLAGPPAAARSARDRASTATGADTTATQPAADGAVHHGTGPSSAIRPAPSAPPASHPSPAAAPPTSSPDASAATPVAATGHGAPGRTGPAARPPPAEA
ncbi:hypothetical protein ADK60_04025, partial [Streptomyces sp. XY431]